MWQYAGFERGAYWARNAETNRHQGFPVERLLDDASFADAKARRDEFVKIRNGQLSS